MKKVSELRVDCSKCPGALVDVSFRCTGNPEYSYSQRTDKFYEKLVELNARRLRTGKIKELEEENKGLRQALAAANARIMRMAKQSVMDHISCGNVNETVGELRARLRRIREICE
jgi:hypothetical protein